MVGWGILKSAMNVFKKICGESASVSDEICKDWKIELQSLLKDYEPKEVFNADETGLF